jgi:pimeloyl-ACP methyl ester carboxylesterase
MLDMPPLRFADLPGLRMGYYEAGPTEDPAPLVLLHGWPELAFSWRHQIKAFAGAGIRGSLRPRPSLRRRRASAR